MLSMPRQIELYEQMSALSSQMVEAAKANDWGRLVTLEKSISALRDILMVEDDNSALSPADLEQKRTLIQRILDDDAEIRRHTEPWMEQVRQFLGGSRKRRQVEKAYGAG